MSITEAEARDIAGRWGKVCGSQSLTAFAETGLIEDRKRLLEAILRVRHFLKHPDELDRLRDYVQKPGPCETAAHRQGWIVENGRICHIHDLERSVSYKTWPACCEGEDIVVDDALES